MRYLIPITLALSPVFLMQSIVPIANSYEGDVVSSGRGDVIPPTAHELQQTKCLATMIYGEARGESATGKVAVAYSAVNRAVKKSVCEVVLAPYQYSIFNNNPALKAAALTLHIDPRMKNSIEERAWKESLEVAQQVLNSEVADPTNGATHYLAPKAMAFFGFKYPKWSKVYTQVAVIDDHVFYKK